MRANSGHLNAGTPYTITGSRHRKAIECQFVSSRCHNAKARLNTVTQNIQKRWWKGCWVEEAPDLEKTSAIAPAADFPRVQGLAPTPSES